MRCFLIGAGKASAKPYVKRGRPSNASKAAAAAEAAARAAAEAEMAAAEHSGDDQLGSPRGVLQGFPGAPHGDAEGGLTQEEWERMGFQGQLQRVEGMPQPTLTVTHQ